MLNENMTQSDIKIVLYEIYTRLKEGEQLENIIDGFPYFDHLFVSMYKMYLKNPKKCRLNEGLFRYFSGTDYICSKQVY